MKERVLTLPMVQARLEELEALQPFNSEDLEFEYEVMLSHKAAFENEEDEVTESLYRDVREKIWDSTEDWE